MNSKRVAAVYCVYDDERWLAASLESVYDCVEGIFVLVGNRPWNGPVTSNVGTLKIVSEFPDPVGKIKIIPGNWKTETDQRNDGLKIIHDAGFGWCFVVDADEVYQPEQLRRMRAFALGSSDIGCFHAIVKVYWKSLRYRIEPPEQFKPPVFVRVGLARFSEHRNVATEKHAVIPENIGFCHHLSYARSDEEVQRKLASFSHSHELVPDWYEKVWSAWDKNPEMIDLHPTHPPAYKQAVKTKISDLPEPLRARWEKGL